QTIRVSLRKRQRDGSWRTGFRGAGRMCHSRNESPCRRTNFFLQPVSTTFSFVTRIAFPHGSSRPQSDRAIIGQFSGRFSCHRSFTVGGLHFFSPASLLSRPVGSDL